MNSIVPSKYSSSTTTESGSNSERTIALGQALAAELDAHDLLGRWVAHYIAELISRVEAATAADRPRLEQECIHEIERLWAHRTHLPVRRPPMTSFDPLYRTLDHLSSDNPTWSFYRHFDNDTEPDPEETLTNNLLRAARDLEAAARDVVRTLIVEAADIAEQRESQWIEAASHLKDEEFDFLSVVRRMRRKESPESAEETTGDEKSPAHAAIHALDKIITACSQAKAALQEREDQPRENP